MGMLNRNPKRLSAEVFSSAQKQPKQNASSQNREENGSTTLRNKGKASASRVKELNLVVMGWSFVGLLISFGMLRVSVRLRCYNNHLQGCHKLSGKYKK